MQIKVPSVNERVIVPHKSFRVEGVFDVVVPVDSKFIVELYDENNKLVRHCYSDIKNNNNIYIHPELTKYSDEDLNNLKLQEFGFPELIVKDTNNPLVSLKDATIKCFYNDELFKAIIVCETNNKYLDDGMHYTDENNKPYSYLEKGKYKLVCRLLDTNNNELDKDEIKIEINDLDNALICRFNPKNHKERIIKWADENGYSTLRDPAVGYLDSYLGEWKYHMGLLQLYRANDIALYANGKVRMFVYDIDETSTSYATELAYLQANNLVNERLYSYYYDIGEAKLFNREAKILEFDDEIIKVCRVDVINDLGKDNYFNLNNESIINSNFNENNFVINKYSRIAIMGVLKPIQLNKDNFILNKDNTYTCKQKYEKLIYTINGSKIEKQIGLNRFDNKDIGKSLFEFLNVFEVLDKDQDINIELYDNLNNKIAHKKMTILVS